MGGARRKPSIVGDQHWSEEQGTVQSMECLNLKEEKI